MFKKLYNFKRNAWHVKLFKWVYDKDPSQIFRVMCPYFWSLVPTILLLPLILIIKLFGKAGTHFLESAESYRRNRNIRLVEEFKEKCRKENLTPQEGYNIVLLKCWNNYRWEIPHKLMYDIGDLYDEHRKVLCAKSREKEKIKEQRVVKYKEMKESKIFTVISIVFSFAMFLMVIGLILYGTIFLLDTYTLDYKIIKAVGLGLLGFSIIAITVFLFLKYIGSPLLGWIQCRKCPNFKGLLKIFIPFIWLFKGIAIGCDMIYLTYKKACPVITWEEEEK